jgi:hypothetical protein
MTNLEKEFEEFLQDKHGKQYVGTDDNMPDDYEEWLSRLDIQEVIDYALSFIKANYVPKGEEIEVQFVEDDECYTSWYKCGNCGDTMLTVDSRYCPNCGRKVKT